MMRCSHCGRCLSSLVWRRSTSTTTTGSGGVLRGGVPHQQRHPGLKRALEGTLQPSRCYGSGKNRFVAVRDPPGEPPPRTGLGAEKEETLAIEGPAVSTTTTNTTTAESASPLDSSPRAAHGSTGGVLFDDERDDVIALTRNYSAEALAKAVRDRTDLLHHCLEMANAGRIDELREALAPYMEGYGDTLERRRLARDLNIVGQLRRKQLNLIRSCLVSSPTHISAVSSKHAAVIIPLCNVDGVASILFEKRSHSLRSYPGQVCFPGGKVDDVDKSFIEASLRELSEEVGIDEDDVEFLGVLPMDHLELREIVGIAVTPVVGFLGELDAHRLHPNADEVYECFTVPLSIALSESKWQTDVGCSEPVFLGGPSLTWGLTASILRMFILHLRSSFQNLRVTQEEDFRTLA